MSYMLVLSISPNVAYYLLPTPSVRCRKHPRP